MLISCNPKQVHFSGHLNSVYSRKTQTNMAMALLTYEFKELMTLCKLKCCLYLEEFSRVTNTHVHSKSTSSGNWTTWADIRDEWWEREQQFVPLSYSSSNITCMFFIKQSRCLTISRHITHTVDNARRASQKKPQKWQNPHFQIRVKNTDHRNESGLPQQKAAAASLLMARTNKIWSTTFTRKLLEKLRKISRKNYRNYAAVSNPATENRLENRQQLNKD